MTRARVRAPALSFLAALFVALTSGSMPLSARAEAAPAVSERFVQLASGVPAVLYEPSVTGERAAIAIFAMHSNADYLRHSVCTELARRGFRVLCANNSLGKSGRFQEGRLDQIMLEAKLGVDFLQAMQGVRNVVLFGHSGGGTLMSAYQMIAEGGIARCRGPKKIHQCPESLADLTQADGLLLIDSNWGQATMALLSVDPGVTNEATGYGIDPFYDLFNPANGFDPKGSHYDEAFVMRFQKQQGKRMNRLILSAQRRAAAIAQGMGRFEDDEPLTIPGASLLGFNNKLFPQDTRFLAHTRAAWPVLKKNGSTVSEIVRSVRAPRNTEPFSQSTRGALNTSVEGFLSTYAIRTTADYHYGEDGIEGIDWDSTYAATPSNVAHVAVPTLVMGMTGGWEFLASETIFNRSASRDKAMAFVEGADHLYRPCDKCLAPAATYGDTVKRTYDFIADWLSQPGRFPR
jgi:pimeloyl-ACP methyl ester carboxylesterase